MLEWQAHDVLLTVEYGFAGVIWRVDEFKKIAFA